MMDIERAAAAACAEGVDTALVEALTALLAGARAGDIHSLAVVGVRSDGQVFRRAIRSVDVGAEALVGVLAMLQADIIADNRAERAKRLG